MTRVRKDSHGLYVRTGGYVFRPEPSAHTVGRSAHPTKINEGDQVKARHISGTPWGRVGGEIWHDHGSYIDDHGKQISTNLIWDPKKRT